MSEMKKAVALTAYNRIGYLNQVLDSWRNVTEFEGWDFFVSVEPSPVSGDVVKIIKNFFNDVGLDPYRVTVNPTRWGVLEHPYQVFDRLFGIGYDYIVRVEDDLLVANDFLKFVSWAGEKYRDDKDVAAVIGYSGGDSEDPTLVNRQPGFGPWNWGTWKDRWDEYIGPTWDHDYSTFNYSPGNQAGWDWNLNTRVLPLLDKVCVSPAMSRVQNIGREGTHATPDEFPQSPSFPRALRGSGIP